jgi:drug/metabolite transporter (DMT)-like permease
MLWMRGQWRLLFDREARRDLLLTSLFITSLFVLIFIALRYTTAGNVAVILVLQLSFSWLYFNVIGRERMALLHTLGAGLMGLGAVVILFPDDFRLNVGDGLALLAAAIAPVANFFQQRARRRVPSIVVLGFRNVVALPVLLLLAMVLEPPVDLFADGWVLFWLLCNALLIFVVAKVLWVEALNHVSVTRLSAMASFIPVFTLVFAWLILGEVPQLRQVLGVAPVVLGAWLMTREV